LLSCALAISAISGCGGSARSGDGPPAPVTQAGTGASAGNTNLAGGGGRGGQSAENGGGSSSSTGGKGGAGAAGASPGGGQGGMSIGGAPPCQFTPPQCPPSHATCAQIGATESCYVWSVCHSAPSQMICCDTGWEPGFACPNGDGSGGDGGASSSDVCEACNAQPAHICVLQQGGPGAAHFVCADQLPCGAAGACSCIPGQGQCEATRTSGPAGYCTCDNGLE